ncbi:MAG: class I SAM-dependent methyltransferase [Alistipes sp.]|jgi:hypothetical protein|nr:class I SAM-dependent methyltransferase [Alistipes sp.]
MQNDLDIFLSDEFRRTVESCLERDPVRIALDRRVPHAALVASQVKYLGRARNKLPSYFEARCIVPPKAFEQASSEATAARKEYSGAVAIDLTCGLGVDSLGLSKRFGRVIALERDPFLAAVARENFRRLGAANIEVVNTSAGDFLSASDLNENIDLIYVDPDRRDTGGKKMVRLEDCSPDVVALLPVLRRIAPRLVVKLSPLFDVDEVFRVFGSGARVEVVSLGGECKEIIADIRFDLIANPIDTADPAASATSTVCAVAIGLGKYEALPSVLTDGSQSHSRTRALAQPFEAARYRYLIIPDVALQKARLAVRYLREHGVWTDSDNGYGFAAEKPAPEIIGRVLEIESLEPFDPKALKRTLKAQGVKSIDILRRDFPHSTAEIARTLGVKEGGPRQIAFTRAADRLWQITLKS